MYKIYVFFEHRICEIIMYFVWCLKISCYIESIRKFTVYCLIVYLSAFNSIHSNLQFHNDSDKLHDYVNIYTFWVVAQISKYISYTNNKQLNEAFNETLFCCTSSYALTKIQLFSILLLFVKNNENNLYELATNASKTFCVMHLLLRLNMYEWILRLYFPKAIIKFSPQINILTTYLDYVIE